MDISELANTTRQKALNKTCLSLCSILREPKIYDKKFIRSKNLQQLETRPSDEDPPESISKVTTSSSIWEISVEKVSLSSGEALSKRSRALSGAVKQRNSESICSQDERAEVTTVASSSSNLRAKLEPKKQEPANQSFKSSNKTDAISIQSIQSSPLNGSNLSCNQVSSLCKSSFQQSPLLPSMKASQNLADNPPSKKHSVSSVEEAEVEFIKMEPKKEPFPWQEVKNILEAPQPSSSYLNGFKGFQPAQTSIVEETPLDDHYFNMFKGCKMEVKKEANNSLSLMDGISSPSKSKASFFMKREKEEPNFQEDLKFKLKLSPCSKIKEESEEVEEILDIPLLPGAAQTSKYSSSLSPQTFLSPSQPAEKLEMQENLEKLESVDSLPLLSFPETLTLSNSKGRQDSFGVFVEEEVNHRGDRELWDRLVEEVTFDEDQSSEEYIVQDGLERAFSILQSEIKTLNRKFGKKKNKATAKGG